MIEPVPTILLEAFPPSSQDLLARLANLVTDDMLEDISQADYGMDAAAHLAALRQIRDSERVPSPLPYKPREVLELVWCTEPDDQRSPPGRTGVRGHIMRAFCCAALLRSGADPASDGYLYGGEWTLIQLIPSVLFLDDALPEGATRFLTWRFPLMSSNDEDRPFFAFGLVALALLSRRDPPGKSDVDSLVTFVEQAEAAAWDPLGVCPPEIFNELFFAAIEPAIKGAAWRALAAQVRSAAPESPRLAALCRRIEHP